MQRRHFQGDYATAFLTLVFQMECQVRALQMNDRGIAEKQTIAGKCFNFALNSRRRKLTIWPKRTSMSKSFIANYRDERLFMCKWAIKGECNLSSRCATTVESRDGDVNVTWKRENKCRSLHTPIRKPICDRGTLHENLYSGKWRCRRSLAERSIYCRLKLYGAISRISKRIIKQKLALSVVATWRNIPIIYGQNRTRESRVILPRYVGGIARRTILRPPSISRHICTYIH